MYLQKKQRLSIVKMSSKLFRRNFLLILFVVFIMCIYLSALIVRINNQNKQENQNNKILCYKAVDPNRSVPPSIEYFDDILNSKKQPSPGKAIFFHETGCHDGIVNLNAKQACAIESTALWNPGREIFVIFASPVGLNSNGNTPPYIAELQKYKNIHFRNVDIWRYSTDTPVAEWIETNKLFRSAYLYEHMSDYLRAVTLYKYGGLYMDLDIVVQRSLSDLDEDFIGDDWGDVVAGGVMHLNNFGIGREMSGQYLKGVIKNFDESDFLANGPTLLTQIFADICNTVDRKLWTRKRCHGLKLQAKETFYPVSWTNYMMYFKPEKLEETLKLAENSSLIHVWNDRSKNIWNLVGTNNAYQVTAKKNCPLVYASSEYF